MPKNISFSMTTDQILNKTKTVTRRFSWWDLSVGTQLQPVVKCMGLKKGEKIKKLGGLIEIISVKMERLDKITDNDVILEGFPHWKSDDFINFLQKHYKCDRGTIINRIKFKYLK